MAIEEYLRELGRHRLLSPEETFEAARSARLGNKKARELLINSNLRLVISIAKSYSRDGRLLEELIQRGNLGLIKAADTFDPEKGFQFSTYATWKIRGEIFSSLRSEGEIIRMTVSQRKLKKRIYGIIEQYASPEGEEPSPQIIADELNRNKTGEKYTEEDVRTLLQMYKNNNVFSLNTPLYDGEREYSDFVPADERRDLTEEISKKSIDSVVLNAIDNLNADEVIKLVLRKKYEHKSANEIAEEMGIPRARVQTKLFMGKRLLYSALKDNKIILEHFGETQS